MEAESRRLIADGLPDRPVQLSRRRRFAPVAVDVDGDVAGTWFVRRGVGCFWDEIHLLVHQANGWSYKGGGGGSSGEACAGTWPLWWSMPGGGCSCHITAARSWCGRRLGLPTCLPATPQGRNVQGSSFPETAEQPIPGRDPRRW